MAAALIWINDRSARLLHHGREWREAHPMPIDTLVVALMALAFGAFAATLYWADRQTRGLSR